MSKPTDWEMDAEIVNLLHEINMCSYSISDEGMHEELYRIYDVLRKYGVEV